MAATAQHTSPAQLELFEQRLPRKPYCTDDLAMGLKIRSLTHALKMPYIQANPPHLRFWMIHDVDRPGAAMAWDDAGLPAPAWATTNPENGHAHIAWGLKAPVLVGDGARDAPVRFLCAVESAYRTAVGGDPGYSGLITKNPTHGRWRTLRGPAHFYDLAELAEYVDLAKHTPKRGAEVTEIGLGRNVTLFDQIRQWAYFKIWHYRSDERARMRDMWHADVYEAALKRNGDFRYPLSPEEVKHLAKSVAKWVWERDAGAEKAFKARQAWKGRRGGVAKGEAYAAKRERALQLRNKGIKIGEIAAELDVAKRTIIRWLDPKVTIA